MFDERPLGYSVEAQSEGGYYEAGNDHDGKDEVGPFNWKDNGMYIEDFKVNIDNSKGVYVHLNEAEAETD